MRSRLIALLDALPPFDLFAIFWSSLTIVLGLLCAALTIAAGAAYRIDVTFAAAVGAASCFGFIWIMWRDVIRERPYLRMARRLGRTLPDGGRIVLAAAPYAAEQLSAHERLEMARRRNTLDPLARARIERDIRDLLNASIDLVRQGRRVRVRFDYFESSFSSGGTILEEVRLLGPVGPQAGQAS